MSDPSPAQFRSGLLFGVVAYVCWGAVPLYFAQVKTVPAVEILAHRIVWSVPLMLGVVAVTPGGVAKLLAVLRSRKLVLGLLLSAAFLTVNWLLYIYATVTGNVAEASLGYFMMPLANAALAMLFLGERLRPLHYPALALVAMGVAVPLAAGGQFTGLAVALPITFGLYGLVRKKLPVDSATGLAVETLLLCVPCGVYLVSLAVAGGGAFGLHNAPVSGWLLLGGVVTVVPLLTYTLSIRRIPLLTQSLIQFISPTVQLLIAIVVLHEPMPWERWVAMGCVWAAVGVFVADAVMQGRRRRAAVVDETGGAVLIGERSA